MTLHLIKSEQDMAQVIHGVNRPFKNFSLSNYSLTNQIIIINLSTAFLALVFIIIFNSLLLISNKNLETHKKKIDLKLTEITNYLAANAIKRILTFDDTCNRIFKEANKDCNTNKYSNKNYQDKPPQLDPTYTQKYIYSNFLKSNLSVKVFADNWIKFADTNDFYVVKEEILISDINTKVKENIAENRGFYSLYKKTYFNIYNLIQKYLDEQKLKKLKNDNITVMEIIKTQKQTSYMFKDQENNFKSIFAKPILKNDKVYGVVLIIAPLTYENNDSAYLSILLTNFFIFFISIMFFLSLLFSKSIVKPIKILSQNTQLERDKSYDLKNLITYPNRNDEIGTLSKDIKSMSVDLKKRIKDIEEFAADVSHELKNPLSGLKSASDLLKTQKIDLNNSKLLMQNISRDINRMNILISDISNYTLTQVEISEEIFEDVELIDFFNEFKSSLHYQNVLLEIQSKEKEVYIKINKNKFIQVFNNLLDNSLSFSKKNSKILIFVKIEDKNCFIDFVDQGSGIPLEYKNKIFQRFYTDRDKNKKVHSGLGLSISKNIIESFGGTINLIKNTHSSFDGACFEIKLPLKETSKNL